jgi:ElaB/YqjD/DUF883 family membrane-anchored ribosome-binding protein
MESETLDGTTAGGDKLQQAAGDIADQAARTAEATASTGMTKAGETLDQVAQAIRDAGSGLREQQPQIASVVDTAAERVEEVSSYLREHDAREAVENVQRFAREQPAVVIGGGLALGLLLGRFLKSGASGNGNGSGRYGSTAANPGYGLSDYGASGISASGYETSSAGYAGGGSAVGGYASGAAVADTLALGGASSSSVYDDTLSGPSTRSGNGLSTGTDPLDDLSAEFLGDDASIAGTSADDEAGSTSATTSSRSSRKKR